MLLLMAALGMATPADAERRGDPISARTTTGAPFALTDNRGNVVIVNFWATWCAPCRAEMPALDAYYRQHRDAGLALIAISLDASATRKQVERATQGFAFAVARIGDVHMARSAIPSALPTTRIYGRDGRLRYASDPLRPVPFDATTLERIVAPLLAEPAPTIR